MYDMQSVLSARSLPHQLRSTVSDFLPDSSTYTRIALGIFTLGFFLDTLTTGIFITHYGFIETNPIIDVAYHEAGYLGMTTAKLAFVTGAYTFVTHFNLFSKEDAFTLSFFMNGLVWGIAGIHNLHVFLS